MIYTVGKSKIDGLADTKYRTKYELPLQHTHTQSLYLRLSLSLSVSRPFACSPARDLRNCNTVLLYIAPALPSCRRHISRSAACRAHDVIHIYTYYIGLVHLLSQRPTRPSHSTHARVYAHPGSAAVRDIYGGRLRV